LIALVATLLIAAYVLGPDLTARWVLSFVVPRKNLTLSKSEEITRGVLWSIVPFGLAWGMRHWGPFSLPANARIDLQTFFSGLYSETFFNQHSADFFAAAGSFWQLNLCLCLRLYAVVLITSILFNFLITEYGRLRKWLESRKSWYWSLVRRVLATFVLPRISEWHLILSPVLLASKSMNIEIDVLTKNGILYAGRLADKVLSASGDLQSITLAKPRRFRREDLLKAREVDPKVPTESFWKPIPGEMFVVVASEIATLNIRHIPAVPEFAAKFDDIASLVKELAIKLKTIEAKSVDKI
jgi:hypothetical protein